jgi:hypothetical protein
MAKRSVDELLAERAHPLHAEVQVLRTLIKGVDPRITEEWKWNAPSFSFAGYLVTFNLRPDHHVHLVFHDGALIDDGTGFLQGDYPDRRMAYFATMDEVRAKGPELVRAIQRWIALKGG